MRRDLPARLRTPRISSRPPRPEPHGTTPRADRTTRPAATTVLLACLQLAFLQLPQGLPAQATGSESYRPGELFEAVDRAIASAYHDRAFRTHAWPPIAARYERAARTADDLAEERAVVDALLSQIPASHLALYSKATHEHLIGELMAREVPTLGLELERRAGSFFVAAVLEGGPAATAGVQRGDRVLAVDGVPPGASVRLDRSSDDAYLPDPPRHRLLAADGEAVQLLVRRTPDGEPFELDVVCAPYSAWLAAQASVRVHEVAGERIGYVHYWFIHMGGVHGHFREVLREALAECDACVLDLRGRGGDGTAVEPLVKAVRQAEVPIVALIDRGTRSAKEVIAYRLRQEDAATLVGEPTAGAVIPATFRRVGKDDVLMFPTFTLGKYTTALEGIGVEPHVLQEDALPYSSGEDPILLAGLREAARRAAAAR